MRSKNKTHKHNSNDEDYKPTDEQGIHESDEDDFQPRVKKRTKRRINVDRSTSTQSTSTSKGGTSTQSVSVSEGSISTVSTSTSNTYNAKEPQTIKRRKVSLSLNKQRKADVIMNETTSQGTKSIKKNDNEDDSSDDDNVVKAISQSTNITSKNDDEIPDQRAVYVTIYRNVIDYVDSGDDEECEEWILDENRLLNLSN